MNAGKMCSVVGSLLLLNATAAFAEDKPAAKPAAAKPAAAKPEAAKAEAAKPEAAKADAGKPMGPPPVPKEMDELKAFVGEWKCTGDATGPDGKTHKVTADNVIKADLGGYWQHVKHHELKSKEHPMEFTAEGWWGYDASAKTFTGLFAGSYGASDLRTSKGWEGDTFVWTGDLHGFMGAAKTPCKHSFTKKSDKEVLEKFEVQMGGKWVPLQDNVCKKK